jgi:hypothetical protein
VHVRRPSDAFSALPEVLSPIRVSDSASWREAHSEPAVSGQEMVFCWIPVP